MSHRTTTRVAATTGLAVVTASLGLAFAPSALAAGLTTAPTGPASVVAGQVFTVSGSGCVAEVDPEYPDYEAGVLVVTDMTDPEDTEALIFLADPTDAGDWTAEVAFPAGTPAGAHEVYAACATTYTGLPVEYPALAVTVTAPGTTTPTPDGPKTEAPKTDAPKTDAPKTETPAPGAIRGESANTAGVAAQTTGAVTKNAVLGQKVVKVYKGFKPFEVVTLTMHSTPTVIGTFDADADGVVTAEFALPAGTTAGTHTLVLEGNQGTYFQESLQVAAATTDADGLAYTGASIALPLSLGAGLLAAGAGALVVSRRRSGASQA